MLRNTGTHITGGVLFVTIFVTMAWFIGLGNDEQFDSGAWLRSNPRDRGRMAQHLVDNQLLVGRSVEEVRSSLGAPDVNWGKVHQYQIDLGWPFKKPTTYGLQIHYDAHRNVQLVKIVD
jgi:hypothetical protein